MCFNGFIIVMFPGGPREGYTGCQIGNLHRSCGPRGPRHSTRTGSGDPCVSLSDGFTIPTKNKNVGIFFAILCLNLPLMIGDPKSIHVLIAIVK